MGSSTQQVHGSSFGSSGSGGAGSVPASRQPERTRSLSGNQETPPGVDLDSLKGGVTTVDSSKLAADIGSTATGSSLDLGAALIGRTGADEVNELGENKTGTDLQISSAAVSGAGTVATTASAIEVGIVTSAEAATAAAAAAAAAEAAAAAGAAAGAAAASGGTAAAVGGGAVATVGGTGAAASASLGPFFWVGLIATAVAIGITAIATEVTKSNKKKSAKLEATTQKLVTHLQKLKERSKKPDILKSTLLSQASSPSSSGKATMEVLPSTPTVRTA